MGDLRGDHGFPCLILVLDKGQDIGGADREVFRVEIAKPFDESILEQVGVKVGEIWGNIEVVGGDDLTIGHELRVNVEFDSVFEKSPETFKDSPLEV